jgi:hypothetical protein
MTLSSTYSAGEVGLHRNPSRQQGVLHFYAAHYSDILHVFGDKQGFGKVQISNMVDSLPAPASGCAPYLRKDAYNARTARIPLR